MDFLKMIQDQEQQLIDYRRHFHQYPELSGVEYETLNTIKAELKKMNIEFIHIPDGGIIGFIGDKAKGKTILLRGDIDALPIVESPENLNQPKVCLSKIDGVSHMCGHDGHTAMLLMEAKILKEIEDQLDGRVIICFEQGEEGTGNFVNILSYIDDHDLAPDSVYAAHVQSSLPSGKVSIEPGAVLAGAFGFNFILEGQGGHGSRPDMSNSPIDCFVAINESLSVLRMKYVTPFDSLAFSIGTLEAGNKANVIPGKLQFGGTCRFFNTATGAKFREDMFNHVEGLAKLYGLKCTETGGFSPSLCCVNDAKLAQAGQAVIKKYLGEDHLIHADPWMVSESFSVYLDKYTGVLALLGINNEAVGSGGEHHSPDFDLDEGALKYGVAAAVGYAYEYLKNNDK